MAQLEKVRKSLPAAVKVTCDKSNVYAYGYRSGDKGMSMNPSKLNHCVGENKQLLNDEYIKGYHAGVKAAQEDKKSEPRTQNIYIHTGSKKRECIEYLSGEVCGYDCKKVHVNAGCAKVPTDNCVTTSWDVTCGTNCRIDDWKNVKCEKITFTSDEHLKK